MILSDDVVPAGHGIGPDFLFIQDTARPHSAAITMAFLNEHEICTISWSALSLDLAKCI